MTTRLMAGNVMKIGNVMTTGVMTIENVMTIGNVMTTRVISIGNMMTTPRDLDRERRRQRGRGERLAHAEDTFRRWLYLPDVGALHVALDDAAFRSGACDGGDIEAPLGRQLAGQR